MQYHTFVLEIKNKTIFLLFIFTLYTSSTIYAQCAMCRAIPSSNLEAGGNIANGLNTGILYLMAVPYILILAFVAFYFREKIKAVYIQFFVAK